MFPSHPVSAAMPLKEKGKIKTAVMPPARRPVGGQELLRLSFIRGILGEALSRSGRQGDATVVAAAAGGGDI